MDFFAYDGLIDYYESIFGRSNLSVFLYEDFCTDPYGFLSRFTAELDLDVDPPPVSPVNAGYRSRTLALLRFVNHFHNREIPNSSCIVHIPGLYRLLRTVGPRLDRLPLMGSVEELDDYLDAPAVTAIEDRYRESNERLEKNYALGLAERGYPMPRGA